MGWCWLYSCLLGLHSGKRVSEGDIRLIRCIALLHSFGGCHQCRTNPANLLPHGLGFSWICFGVHTLALLLTATDLCVWIDGLWCIFISAKLQKGDSFEIHAVVDVTNTLESSSHNTFCVKQGKQNYLHAKEALEKSGCNTVDPVIDLTWIRAHTEYSNTKKRKYSAGSGDTASMVKGGESSSTRLHK